MDLLQDISDKVYSVQKLGFSFYPDPYNWSFEFACQYLETYHRNPVHNSRFIPQIIYGKLLDISQEGEASSSLHLKHIPYIIDDMKKFDVSPAYLSWLGRQPYK